jgi:hypothetical protein
MIHLLPLVPPLQSTSKPAAQHLLAEGSTVEIENP